MKEKENTHIIQKLQLDLEIDNLKKSRKVLESASGLANSKIIPITEKILEEWADENIHVSLDRLEIDLGTVPLDDFDHFFYDAYEKKIRESLAKLFAGEKTGEHSRLTRKNRKQAWLSQLVFFLKEGWVSWEFQQEPVWKADGLVLNLLKADPVNLKAALIPILANVRHVDRLVASLQPDTMDLLLAELAFSDAATQTMLLIGELARFNHLADMGLSRKQIEKAVYRCAFRRAAQNEVICSASSVSDIFKELLTVSKGEATQLADYVKMFGQFVKEEKFLAQFVGLSEELKSSSMFSSEKAREKPVIEWENTSHLPEKNAIFNGSSCYLNNAGLILVYPYLQTIFDRFNWLDENNLIRGNFQMKALLLTDFLVYGDREVVPENELVLNKILCGMPVNEPPDPLAVLSSEEKKEVGDLLKSAIKHWKVLKGTSIESYRAAFLQRDGILRFEDGNWFLKVERKSYDMLLDSLPFAISVIRLPWMKNKLFVEW